ncbi:MAG: thioredoxin family protein [Actinobacteria bacterium]|nr:thioredoxin family protein [Actinomycetota bacterium]MCB9424336.1 thioredoxin family protein [Actinomycetota bacterium]
MQRSLVLGASAAVLAVLAGCGSSDTTTEAPPTSAPPASASAPEPAVAGSEQAVAMPAGAYVDYADYQADPQAYAAGDVVLFFNATWCPTCQEATKNLEAADFPEGLTVVSVDYDSNLDLRKKYGVTTQHTFVQVGPGGEQVTKFTGSTTIPEIQSELA